MKITVEMVKELRDVAGVGVMEAKNALVEYDGDLEKSVEALRKKGLTEAAERSDRDAKEGIVELYAHPGNRVGVMVELNSETDFVARTEPFKILAHDLALHIAAMEPRFVSREQIPQDVLDSKIDELRSQPDMERKPADIVEKIISGRLNKYYEETCLLEQPFVKDDEIKVQDLISDAIQSLGENIIVRRFERYELGEEL